MELSTGIKLKSEVSNTFVYFTLLVNNAILNLHMKLDADKCYIVILVKRLFSRQLWHLSGFVEKDRGDVHSITRKPI